MRLKDFFTSYSLHDLPLEEIKYSPDLNRCVLTTIHYTSYKAGYSDFDGEDGEVRRFIIFDGVDKIESNLPWLQFVAVGMEIDGEILNAHFLEGNIAGSFECWRLTILISKVPEEQVCLLDICANDVRWFPSPPVEDWMLPPDDMG